MLEVEADVAMSGDDSGDEDDDDDNMMDGMLDSSMRDFIDDASQLHVMESPLNDNESPSQSLTSKTQASSSTLTSYPLILSYSVSTPSLLHVITVQTLLPSGYARIYWGNADVLVERDMFPGSISTYFTSNCNLNLGEYMGIILN